MISVSENFFIFICNCPVLLLENDLSACCAHTFFEIPWPFAGKGELLDACLLGLEYGARGKSTHCSVQPVCKWKSYPDLVRLWHRPMLSRDTPNQTERRDPWVFWGQQPKDIPHSIWFVFFFVIDSVNVCFLSGSSFVQNICHDLFIDLSIGLTSATPSTFPDLVFDFLCHFPNLSPQ